FITRKAAGKRGATVTGYSATLEFDWYTEKVRVVDHHYSSRVDEISVKAPTGHAGGDTSLGQAFVALIRGKARSPYTLRAGLISSSMCLAARESSATNTFQRVQAFEELSSSMPARV